MMNLAAAASLGAAKLAALPAAVSAGGDAASFDIVGIMKDSVDTTQAQAFAVLAVVVPAIVVVVAAGVCVRYGIGWIKRIKA